MLLAIRINDSGDRLAQCCWRSYTPRRLMPLLVFMSSKTESEPYCLLPGRVVTLAVCLDMAT